MNNYSRSDRFAQKQTPQVNNYPIRANLKEPRFVELSTLSNLCNQTVNHSAYFNASRENFLILFAGLSVEQITGLSDRQWVAFEGFLIKLHVDREDGYLIVRQGNNYGIAINLTRHSETRAPADIFDSLVTMFKREYLPFGDLRSPGNVAAHILDTIKVSLFLPPEPHRNRFVNSFRGPRFEASIFGNIPNVNDYDISSAYPSELAKCYPTTGLQWIDSTDPAHLKNAVYGAALCDVYIPRNLSRGPIAYRCLEETQFYPVGKLPQCWLNLPELQYLADRGFEVKILQASWGVPTRPRALPFEDVARLLFSMRAKYRREADYIKKVAVSLYGKLISSWNGQTGPGYNPIVASHITSSIRMRLQRMSDDGEIIGEYADGMATTSTYKQTKGLGGLRLVGRGNFVSITDQFHSSDWKAPAVPFIEAIPQSIGKIVTTDIEAITGPASIAHNLAPPSAIGTRTTHKVHLQVGPTARLCTAHFDAKDLLSDVIETKPISVSHIPAITMLRRYEVHGALSYDIA